jgi:amidase
MDLLTPLPQSSPVPHGPLNGLSFVVKDIFDVAGLPTQAGNPQFAQRWGQPTQDAWAVQRLRQAGAQLLGKVHTHELAYGMTGINPHFGTPTNPRAPGHIPGGSSSGSGSAVASGLASLALGSDTGGSVRIPASLCGVWGWRPTHGLLPLEGVVPLAPSYDTAGLLAAGAGILQLAARTLLPPLPISPRFTQALVVSEALEVSHPQAQQATWRLAQQLEKLGITIGEIGGGNLADLRETQRLIQGAQAYSFHAPWLEAAQPQLGADVARLLQMASAFTIGEIGTALSHQASLVSNWHRRWPAQTLLLLPATPSAAPTIQSLRDADAALEFRWRTLTLNTLASSLGCPVLTVPMALPTELPLGVQLLGPRGSDLALLELAQTLG